MLLDAWIANDFMCMLVCTGCIVVMCIELMCEMKVGSTGCERVLYAIENIQQQGELRRLPQTYHGCIGRCLLLIERPQDRAQQQQRLKMKGASAKWSPRYHTLCCPFCLHKINAFVGEWVFCHLTLRRYRVEGRMKGLHEEAG